MNNPEIGASLVITHHVKENKVLDYETWLSEISQVAKQTSGLLDWQLIRPVSGISSTYNVLLRFASRSDLEHWMNSSERKQYIDRVLPCLVDGDGITVGEGLDFLFMQNGPKTSAPKKWKQFLITWSAIFPLTMIVPRIILPALRALGIPAYKALDGLIIAATIVGLMVYVVMPQYTKLVQNWLKK